MYAIAQIQGKQYKVSKGDEVSVDRIAGEAGANISIDSVLLIDDGTRVSVGSPTVSGAKIKVSIVEQYRGEKINVRRYKQKVRERRSIGFRAELTKIRIDDIVTK